MKCSFCNKTLKLKKKTDFFLHCKTCNVTYADPAIDNWFFWKIKEHCVAIFPNENSMTISYTAQEPGTTISPKIIFRDQAVYNLKPDNVESFLNKILSMKAFL